ncbi:AbrB/MazE/SpoVT family DNA-binding domain-containing protein [Sporolactobacillus sp. THM7-7]|nr:AbrB/MazE/SpoVT family DNA-binding domain-containing protein [Sporolactobacillus sp. THM7-7]
MKSAIKKWGNSQGVMINKSLLESVDLQIGDDINIFTDDHRIIIEKARPHMTLRERFAKYDGHYQPEEWQTGKAGKEEL